MSPQKDVFLSSEGDAWYARNQQNITQRRSDVVLDAVRSIEVAPKQILEIGCADGWRLERMRQQFNAECSGIDPSATAIQTGQERYPALSLTQTDAAAFESEASAYDMVIFGFSLYLCDREDLFKIAYLADRALCDGGHLVIYDFYASLPHYNDYVHHSGLRAYKMDYSQMFRWHPHYRSLLEKRVDGHGKPWSNDDINDVLAISILQKNTAQAFVANPYGSGFTPS